MRWRKPVAALVLLLLVFGCGVGVGARYFTHHVRTVMTPQEDGLGEYLKFLDSARRTVHVACYAFTDSRIADKLVELRGRGVEVHVLLDESQTKGRSAQYVQHNIEILQAAGAEVLVGTSEKHHEIMHNKFTVIDSHLTEDGSWNYSKAANFQNNVLNFDDDPLRAGKFMENWHRMHDFMATKSATKKPAH